MQTVPTKKHAYLIMAHNEFAMLKVLLNELDDERNDIFLHIDKKAKNVNLREFSDCVRKSKLVIIRRRRIYWGSYGIVDCELCMLKVATRSKYSYYHLISGVDIPLKSQDYIHSALESENHEFIGYHVSGEDDDFFDYKIKYYYPFMNYSGRGIEGSSPIRRYIGKKLDRLQNKMLRWQERHNFNRLRKYDHIEFYKGNQWFSITDAFARYLISQRRQIRKMFRNTNGPDEFFVPTIALNSEFKDKIINRSLRHIDWKRGCPYEYKNSDYDELVKCDDFFARKVSYEREPVLVERILKKIHNKD